MLSLLVMWGKIANMVITMNKDLWDRNKKTVLGKDKDVAQTKDKD